jgi:hypothetical protein
VAGGQMGSSAAPQDAVNARLILAAHRGEEAMKTRLGIACLLLWGVFAVGCGNFGPQQVDEASFSEDMEGEEPFASIPPEESALQSEESSPDEVEELTACCHVKCKDGKWYGPFPKVKFDHCKEYGQYYCPAHKHGGYASHAWRGC